MNWSFLGESAVCHSISYAEQLHTIDHVFVWQPACLLCHVLSVLFFASVCYCSFSFIACVITTPSNNDPPDTQQNHTADTLAYAQNSSIVDNPPALSKKRSNDNIGESDRLPPHKRGRPSLLSNHTCGQCILFIASGSNESLSKYHKMNHRTRHPLDEYVAFMNYASTNAPFSVIAEHMSCVCDACFRDFSRFKNLTLKNNFVPRWFKIKQEQVGQFKNHCVLCCDGNCTCACDTIQDWGPDRWWAKEGKPFWLNYLSFLNICSNVLGRGLNVCRCHYREIRRNISSKVCVLCGSGEEESWYLVGHMKCLHAAHYSHLLNLLPDTPNPTEWVCSSCFNFVSNDCNLDLMINRCLRSKNPTIVRRVELLQAILGELSKNGIVSSKSYVEDFKKFVCDDTLSKNNILSFKKYIDRAMNLKGFHSYSEVGKPGKLYYNNDLFNEATMPYTKC